jgi:hypothetical protein
LSCCAASAGARSAASAVCNSRTRGGAATTSAGCQFLSTGWRRSLGSMSREPSQRPSSFTVGNEKPPIPRRPRRNRDCRAFVFRVCRSQGLPLRSGTNAHATAAPPISGRRKTIPALEFSTAAWLPQADMVESAGCHCARQSVICVLTRMPLRKCSAMC